MSAHISSYFRQAFLQLIRVVTYCQRTDIPTVVPVPLRHGCRP